MSRTYLSAILELNALGFFLPSSLHVYLTNPHLKICIFCMSVSVRVGISVHVSVYDSEFGCRPDWEEGTRLHYE